MAFLAPIGHPGQSETLVRQLRRAGLVAVHHHGNQDSEGLVAMNDGIGTPFFIAEDEVRGWG